MKLKVFTLRFSGSKEGFDDQPLQDFIADKEVIEYSEHFFIHENTPCFAILIAYRALESFESRIVARQADARLELDGPEKEAYDALRAWRAAAAGTTTLRTAGRPRATTTGPTTATTTSASASPAHGNGL